jgi:ATP-dependent DNA ligase
MSSAPSFQALQHRGSHSGHHIVFYAFDLLNLNGTELTGEPLSTRRAKLPRVVGDSRHAVFVGLRSDERAGSATEMTPSG